MGTEPSVGVEDVVVFMVLYSAMSLMGDGMYCRAHCFEHACVI